MSAIHLNITHIVAIERPRAIADLAGLAGVGRLRGDGDLVVGAIVLRRKRKAAVGGENLIVAAVVLKHDLVAFEARYRAADAEQVSGTS